MCGYHWLSWSRACLVRQLSGFQSRHLSNIQNGRHSKGVANTLARRKKYKHKKCRSNTDQEYYISTVYSCLSVSASSTGELGTHLWQCRRSCRSNFVLGRPAVQLPAHQSSGCCSPVQLCSRDTGSAHEWFCLFFYKYLLVVYYFVRLHWKCIIIRKTLRNSHRCGSVVSKDFPHGFRAENRTRGRPCGRQAPKPFLPHPSEDEIGTIGEVSCRCTINILNILAKRVWICTDRSRKMFAASR